MLNNNVKTEMAMYNSALGTVVDIIMPEGNDINAIPRAIIVELDNTNIPQEHCFNGRRNQVCIETISAPYNESYKRT